MQYYISTDNHLLDVHKIHTLLKDCFWCKNIPVSYIQRFIQYSLCFGVYQKNNHTLVGFARVISDFTTYAYVADVIIDPVHRRLGLGKRLMRTILSHPELQGLKTWSLRSTNEARAIYEAEGFCMAAEPATLLEREDLEIYSKSEFHAIFS